MCVLYSSYCQILRGGRGGGGGGEGTVSKLFIELELFLILILADSFSLSFSEVSALSHRMTLALFHFCIVLLSLCDIYVVFKNLEGGGGTDTYLSSILKEFI